MQQESFTARPQAGNVLESGSLPFSNQHQATITALLALRIALLALWSRRAESITQISVPDAALGVLAAIAIAVLSSFEHVKSPKPSVVLNAYLFFTIILDLASARTYWMRSGLDSIAAVNTATLAVKAILFVLEESPKTLDGSNPAREASAGIISRSLFWWLNRLLFNGSRDILDNEVLGPIDSKFDSEKLLKKLEAAWDKGTMKHCSFQKHLLIGHRQQGWPVQPHFLHFSGLWMAIRRSYSGSIALHWLSVRPALPNSSCRRIRR